MSIEKENCEINYKTTKKINDKQLRPLYNSVDWFYSKEFADLEELLKGSHIVYSAWDGEKLVGLIRTVGDGLSIEYVQDLLVLPNYKKLGIGKALLGYVLEQAVEIHQVALATDASEENQYILDWYKKQGLTPFTEAGVAGFWRKK